MIKVCRNNDIRQLVIHVKKTGNTCPYTLNVAYTPGIVFDSFVSPYGSYSNGVISIASLVNGMEFDMVLNVRITDITQINFTVTATAIQTPGCDTVLPNNLATFQLQKGTTEECINSCEDVTSEACTHDIAYTPCDIPSIIKTLPRCFQCTDGFTNVYSEVSNVNVLSWSVNSTTRQITIRVLDPTVAWSLTLQTTCNKDNCVDGPYGPFTLSGGKAVYSTWYLIDGQGNRIDCDCVNFNKLLIALNEEDSYEAYADNAELEGDIETAFSDIDICWNAEFCLFTGYVESPAVDGPHELPTKLKIPFVDTDGDCPDYCNAGTLDYSKFQKIDLTPYGGAVVAVANDAAVIAAFAALPTPMVVTISGCGVLFALWECGVEYPDVEVVHTTADVFLFLEDGVGTNLTYTNINTTVGFLGMSYDLSAYGGGTHELLNTGLAIANRMDVLTGQVGWLWEDNSGANTSKLHHPSLTTAITPTDIPTQRLLKLIDTDEAISGDGINGQDNGNPGAVIDYTVFTSVNFTPVGGTTKAVQNDGDIVTELAGLGKTGVILLANIHIENWAIATGYGNLEVSFLYECWESLSECPDGTLTNINVDGVNYPFGAVSYPLLPALLLSLGIPGIIAANWDVVEETITISFRHGMGGANVTLTQSCGGEPTLALVKISTGTTTSCVTI